MTEHQAPDFVNKTEDPEERRLKYAFLKLMGYNTKEARIMRDYRKTTIIKKLWYEKHPQGRTK